MSDVEPRRPQYGEYATPEQQAERIRQSGGTPEPVPAPVPVVVPSPVVADASSGEPVVATPPARRGDRFITIALLAYGLFTVVTSIPQLIDYAGFVDIALEMGGIDAEFTATETGRTWGIIAAIVFAAGWIVTALLSWRAMTRGRISWWIPVVGGVVTFAVVSGCLTVPIMSDPTVIEQLLQTR